MIAFRNETERMVYRGLYYDFLIRLDKPVDDHTYTFDNAGDIREPFWLDRPSVQSADPIDDRRAVVRRLDGVAEHRVVQTFAQRVDDKRWCGEIHVGDPQRYEVRIAIAFGKSIGLECS